MGRCVNCEWARTPGITTEPTDCPGRESNYCQVSIRHTEDTEPESCSNRFIGSVRWSHSISVDSVYFDKTLIP